MIHLIYIDDNPDDSYVVKKCLQKISLPIELDCLKSGTEFLNYLQKNEPYQNRESIKSQHFILLDINMPGFNGIEILAKIKEKFSGDVLKIPVIIFSGSKQKEDKEKCINLGVSEYLVKPNSYTETCIILKELLIKWSNPHNTPETYI